MIGTEGLAVELAELADLADHVAGVTARYGGPVCRSAALFSLADRLRQASARVRDAGPDESGRRLLDGARTALATVSIAREEGRA